MQSSTLSGGHVRNLDHTDGRRRDEDSSGGESGLHHAARAGHENVVELLIEYGADMNLEGPQGIPSDVRRLSRAFIFTFIQRMASGGK